MEKHGFVTFGLKIYIFDISGLEIYSFDIFGLEICFGFLECGEYSFTRQWSTDTFTASTLKFGQEVRLPDLGNCIYLYI